MTYIYGLFDPKYPDLIRYIGESSSPKKGFVNMSVKRKLPLY
jgi:hypothetical protein